MVELNNEKNNFESVNYKKTLLKPSSEKFLYEGEDGTLVLAHDKVKELRIKHPNLTGATANRYEDTIDFEGENLTKEEVSSLLLILVDYFELDWDRVTRTVNGEY